MGMGCSSLELSDNPLPDSRALQEIADSERRMRVALGDLYAYFRRRERLWANILSDKEMPYTNDYPEAREADAKIMKPIFMHWGRMQDTLAEGWEAAAETSRLLVGAIELALDFQTWRTMTRKQGLSDEQAIELMVGMVRCASAASVAGPE